MDGDRTVARASGRPGKPVTLEIDRPRPWSPDDPFLHVATVCAKTDDAITDAVFVVDLEGERPGPTLVAFMVVTAPAGDGTWRVRFFGGPGVQWPRYPIPRGDATTTSPAPDAD